MSESAFNCGEFKYGPWGGRALQTFSRDPVHFKAEARVR